MDWRWSAFGGFEFWEIGWGRAFAKAPVTDGRGHAASQVDVAIELGFQFLQAGRPLFQRFRLVLGHAELHPEPIGFGEVAVPKEVFRIERNGVSHFSQKPAVLPGKLRFHGNDFAGRKSG
jgi:hypothetical protein